MGSIQRFFSKDAREMGRVGSVDRPKKTHPRWVSTDAVKFETNALGLRLAVNAGGDFEP